MYPLFKVIRNVDILDVSQHSKTATHIKIEKQMRSHSMFKKPELELVL